MKKNVRRSLVMSLVAMMLCIAMMAGSTFAWFTDSVVSGNNIIKTGTLDIEMGWADGTQAVPTTKDGWDDASSGAIFNYDLWEPGYTEVRHIQIENVGTLALKYQLEIAAEGEVTALADVIDVYYLDPAQAITSRDQLPAQPIGTLSEVLAGMSGVTNTASGVLLPGEGALNVTIALKMQEAAGNEYQDMSIGSSFAVKLFATQYTYEDDSFDDQYDKDAEWPAIVATSADLKAAFANAPAEATIILDADVDLGNTQIAIPAGKKLTLDLNGNDLTGNGAGADHYAMFNIANGGELIIEGEGNVSASTEFSASNRSGAIFQNDGKLTINGGTYTVDDSTVGQTWIISTIIDNRTKSTTSEAVVTINGGEFSVLGNASNLFRNYPQQGGTATIIFNGGKFNANPDKTTTYIWNQESRNYLGELYFNGGIFADGVVYEDYNGQTDIHFANGTVVPGYAGNN